MRNTTAGVVNFFETEGVLVCGGDGDDFYFKYTI